MSLVNSIVSPADAVAAAEAVSARVAANSVMSERARCLDAGSVAAMREVGLFRLLTPSVYGGAEAGLRAQVDSAAVIAQADPAAGWLQVVLNAHSWIVGGFPEACQDEVFDGNPDVLIPGTQAPQGKAEKVPGGWRVSGQWQFCSGADHGEWMLVGAAARPLVHVVVPAADVKIVDTWYTLGLRGTGSKDVVLDDVFVPEHRSIDTRTLFDGCSPHAERHATGLYRLPILAGLTLQLGAVTLGIAKRSLDVFVERTRPRVEKYTKSSKADAAGVQMRVAEAAAEITAAELLLVRAADAFERISRSGAPAAMEERAELKWHAGYVVELCRRSVARIFNASGAHAVFDDSELQRLYRDINTACHHATADFDSSAQMYGRITLGLEPGTVLF